MENCEQREALALLEVVLEDRPKKVTLKLRSEDDEEPAR